MKPLSGSCTLRQENAETSGRPAGCYWCHRVALTEVHRAHDAMHFASREKA